MHGIIFSEMRKYVDAKLGDEGWEEVLVASKLGRRMYLPIQEYPDSDMGALVGAAARILDLPADAILKDFGKFIAPSLLGLYRTLVDPKWKTLDLLENTEHTIHTVVRQRNPGARPARLQVVRKGADAVELTYRSDRRMCAVAKGIIEGVAAHYGETVTIEESTCMHAGAEACHMEIQVVAIPTAELAPAAAANANHRTAAAVEAAKPKKKGAVAKGRVAAGAGSRKAKPGGAGKKKAGQSKPAGRAGKDAKRGVKKELARK